VLSNEDLSEIQAIGTTVEVQGARLAEAVLQLSER
jgi:hypothetical protein